MNEIALWFFEIAHVLVRLNHVVVGYEAQKV
jgi:hypothetical protein